MQREEIAGSWWGRPSNLSEPVNAAQLRRSSASSTIARLRRRRQKQQVPPLRRR
jgi:hypothetical protein